MRTNLKLQLAAVLIVLCSWYMNAQTLPSTYSTSWVGNTFVPSNNGYNFMQGWANSMFVEADGTIYANCFWDEGAKPLGIYKNGQCVGTILN